MTILGRSGLGAVALCLGISAYAHAAPQCGTRQDVLNILKNKYEEQSAAIGIAHNGGLLEVWASPEGDTWSITITSPKGKTCLVAAGSDWQQHTVEDLSGDKI